MREGAKAQGAARANRRARGVVAMPLPARRPVELLSPSPPREAMQIKSTPALSPSKSFTSNSSLPETPLSTSTTLPSSPEVEVTKRVRAVPVQNRAFQMALKGAFEESRRPVLQNRVATNQLSLDFEDEDEPLIDLTEDWERVPAEKRVDIDFAVGKPPAPQPRTEDKHTAEDNIGQGKLSPWSKSFSPRSTATFEQHDTRDLSAAPAEMAAVLEMRDTPLAKPTFAGPFAPISPRKRMQLRSMAYRLSLQRNTNSPYDTAGLHPSPVRPPPNALFVPPIAKSITLRAPESPVQSITILPETPTKRGLVEHAPCFPLGRIVLPYEDDYDSDDDPFFPSVCQQTHNEGRNDGQQEAVKTTSQLEFKLVPFQHDEAREKEPTETPKQTGDESSAYSGILPKCSRFSGLGIGHHPRQVFGEEHDASVVSQAVLRLASEVQPLSHSTIFCEEQQGDAVDNANSQKQWRDRIATEPSLYRCTLPSSDDPTVHTRQRSQYNFTICRAYLRHCACPYGKQCCFKHPTLSAPLHPEDTLAAEKDMGWEEQARVNFGKIRGLLTTGTSDISQEDQASIVLLFADSVCQNAASHIRSLEFVSPDVEKHISRLQGLNTTTIEEGFASSGPDLQADRSSARAGVSISQEVQEYEQEIIESTEGSAAKLNGHRCSPPQQNDID